ncbi:hypothetical protein MEX01_54490 [Methylorubrum extorquens]|nr:hypothetical protein MEX01_54490 [Methylorubrum extorquens]
MPRKRDMLPCVSRRLDLHEPGTILELMPIRSVPRLTKAEEWLSKA